MGNLETGGVSPYAAFGQTLRDLRVSRGLTQAELADLCGFDRSYISHCESGRRNVTLRSIVILAGALDVSPVELLDPKKS